MWRVEGRRSHNGKYVTAAPDRPPAGQELAGWAHTVDGGGGVTNLIVPHLIDHHITLLRGSPTSVSAVQHTFAGDEVDHYLDLRMAFGTVSSRIGVFRETPVRLPVWAVHGTRATEPVKLVETRAVYAL